MEEYVYSVKFIKSFRPFYNKKVPEIQKFLELYTDIEKKDFIKPIYSETNKYNSFPSFAHHSNGNGHGKKYGNGYHKKGGLGGGKKKKPVFMKKGSNAWQPYTPSSNGEKIKKIVISNFNKLTADNFDQVSDQLISDLKSIDCSDVLTILGAEVLKKLLFDKGFYKVYVNLCKKIWSLQTWHDKLVTIIEDDGSFYWCENKINVDEDMKINGPYETMEKLRVVSRREINFRKYLMNMMYAEFCKMDEYLVKFREAIEKKDDDEEFRFRRKVFSNGEFMAELYKYGYVDEKIMNIYFTNLLMMKDFKEDGVDTVKFELFCKMWEIIGRKIGSRGDINIHIRGKILKMKLANRIKFMMEDAVENMGGVVAKQPAKKAWTGNGLGGGKTTVGKFKGDFRKGQKNFKDGKTGHLGNKGGKKFDKSKKNGYESNRFAGTKVWNRFGDGVKVVKGNSFGKGNGSNVMVDKKGDDDIDEDKFFEKCESKLSAYLDGFNSGKGDDFIDEERERLVDEYRLICFSARLGKILLEAILNKALESDDTIDKICPIVSALLKRRVLRRRYIGTVFKELESNLEDIELDIPEARVNFERLRGTKF